MQLRVSSILRESNVHYPGKIASVVFLTGQPFKSLFTQQEGVDTSVEQLYVELSSQADKVDAIVFSGGEPLVQANSLRQLLPMLKGDGFATRIDTSGFYPEALRDLLPFLDYVQLDVKTRFEEAAYARATGNVAPGSVVLSKVLCSLAFLENSRFPVFREFCVTVVDGENDDFHTIESIASYVKKYCDLFTLKQFDPADLLAPVQYAQKPATPPEKLFELAMMARNILSSVAVSVQGKTEQLR